MWQGSFYYLYTTISPVVNFRRELMEYSRQGEERGAYLNKTADMDDSFEIKEVSIALAEVAEKLHLPF